MYSDGNYTHQMEQKEEDGKQLLLLWLENNIQNIH